MFSRVPKVLVTVFPHIVSEETILFLNLEIVTNSNSCAIFHFFLKKLNACFGNYSREETVQGQKLYEEILWLNPYLLRLNFLPEKKYK